MKTVIISIFILLSGCSTSISDLTTYDKSTWADAFKRDLWYVKIIETCYAAHGDPASYNFAFTTIDCKLMPKK